MLLVPGGMQGSDPIRTEIHRALEIRTVEGGTVAKGSQTTILAGHRRQYELRTVLSFRTALPSTIQVQSARLQLFVIRTRGTLPLNIAIHLLNKDFEETEVTYDQAADGAPWSTPGGDYAAAPLGQAPFNGAAYDTISVGLDVVQLRSWLPGRENLSLEVITYGSDDTMVEFLAREGYPDSPTASRLEVVYTESGSSDQLLLDRRAFMDATIVKFEGANDPGNLMISALPARQLFFRYDFSGIPANSTINQASIHLSMARSAFVDSFVVGTYLRTDLGFVPSDAAALGYGIVIGERDTSLVMDVTSAVQKAVREGGGSSNYVVLASLANATTAGFAEIYPPTVADSTKQPYFSVIYSDLPAYAGPGSQSQP
ncbi:DNRLRE domain-containing protein [bacterium]|nr:DNRLRE domain-containing protein [bacterium]